ncbi:Pr6Pr family membrane protein [Occultella kanbiaonis]|uniref:Pr6Pr family membrane protein n=1 Tax=Occultella kanbiaonis TaxID=2675754 RepID=UPI0012B868C8|nr:Pr6Pr family membrane protein [Occultella kanbiaonis]
MASGVNHTMAVPVAIVRMIAGLLVTAVLVYGYAVQVEVGGTSPFDYFGYFTNQTNLLTSLVLIGTGIVVLTGRRVPGWLTLVRGVAIACLLVVAVIYNLLIPGTGSAPPVVSAILHLAFPLAIALDWLLVGDRGPLAWRRLWLVLPYPLLWLLVVLVRGVTDGWVPYGFLLPERGPAALGLHVVALLGTLLAAGALVWSASRAPGRWLRTPGRTVPSRV